MVADPPRPTRLGILKPRGQRTGQAFLQRQRAQACGVIAEIRRAEYR